MLFFNSCIKVCCTLFFIQFEFEIHNTELTLVKKVQSIIRFIFTFSKSGTYKIAFMVKNCN
ncbi:hypothetical protein BpHYR1_037870 [Brachionus plicatilis]|uniref:Uncharacterized protein n=1 Tax=Brachionus plicatilis TaxID=10195 RepID=A0A3M7QWE9_BRAPC|nr:hypothetical protein BpHYR1_037870 [Brachionus plicatilis]